MASSTNLNMYPGIDAFLYPNTLKSPTGQFAINLPGTLSGGVTVPAPKIGPGNVLYQSELIRQLREANKNPMTNNPGVTLLDNPKNSTLVLDFNKPVPKNMSNRPPVLKITPTTPTPPGGDNNTGGGGGGGGDRPIVIGPGGGTPIVIGPFDPTDPDPTDPDPTDPDSTDPDPPEVDPEPPVVDESTLLDPVDDGNDDGQDTEGLDQLIDDLTKDDQVVDDKDTEGLDQLIDGLTKDDNQDTEGLDQLIDDAVARDDASNVPDYTDDLWPPLDDESVVDTSNQNASAELKAGDNIVVEGDGIINFGDGNSDNSWSEWDDWSNDAADVPDLPDDLGGDLGENFLFFDPGYDFNFGFDGWDAGGFSGGGGGGNSSSLLHQFMLE